MYQRLHEDLKGLSIRKLEVHYAIQGYKEGRDILLDIPKDFDANVYRKLNEDLVLLSNEELEVHYYRNGKEEKRKYKEDV